MCSPQGDFPWSCKTEKCFPWSCNIKKTNVENFPVIFLIFFFEGFWGCVLFRLLYKGIFYYVAVAPTYCIDR